jgi:flagellar hook protein FlgE
MGFDEDGVLRANYSNDNNIAIAKLAVSGFTAPENLTPYNTTLFEANGETGNEYYVDLDGLISPESLEGSTVNLEEEFSQMIVV